MNIAAVSQVHARMEQITARFDNASSFAAALSNAQSAVAPQAVAAGAGNTSVATAASTGDTAGPAQRWAHKLPAAAQQWVPHIEQAARRHDLDPRLLAALVKQESGFRADARSHAGAIGLTQLMPSTAKWLEPNIPTNQLFDTRTNLRVGFNYLRKLLDEYDGNERLALTAYNRGPGTVNRMLRSGRNPDNGYAQFVSKGESAKHVALMRAKFGG